MLKRTFYIVYICILQGINLEKIAYYNVHFLKFCFLITEGLPLTKAGFLSNSQHSTAKKLNTQCSLCVKYITCYARYKTRNQTKCMKSPDHQNTTVSSCMKIVTKLYK